MVSPGGFSRGRLRSADPTLCIALHFIDPCRSLTKGTWSSNGHEQAARWVMGEKARTPGLGWCTREGGVNMRLQLGAHSWRHGGPTPPQQKYNSELHSHLSPSILHGVARHEILFFCVEDGAAGTSRRRATGIWIARCGGKTKDGGYEYIVTLQRTNNTHEIVVFIARGRQLAFWCTKLNGRGSVKNVSSAADEDSWRTLHKVAEKSRDQLSVQSVCSVKKRKIPKAVFLADMIDRGDVRRVRLPCFSGWGPLPQ